MAICIIIKIQDQNLFKLIKNRLSIKFPDAYIIPENSDNLEEAVNMSEFTTCIYDNNTFQDDCGDIPLYIIDENGNRIIDCSLLAKAIRKVKGESIDPIDTDTHMSRMHLLLSYAYIDERERNINKLFRHLLEEADFSIRIDLMSGIRMSSPIKTGLDYGSLTTLLREVNSTKFKPKRILDYLNPELSGFLTPGRPENTDDVFEYGIGACTKLTMNLQKLTRQEDININALVVIEGFRISEVKKLLPNFDDIHFLIPSRMCDENLGLQDVITSFNSLLKNTQKMHIHYCENNKLETIDETHRA